MRRFLFPFLIFPALLSSALTKADRIHAHLMVQDPDSACEEARNALALNPGDCAVWEGYLQALAQAGREKEMMSAWHGYEARFPERDKKPVLESLAWGVIEEGSRSSSPLLRIVAMVAGHLTSDIRGVGILQERLKDRNIIVRKVALQLASQRRDPDLGEEVMRIFRTDSNAEVRLEAIKALGSMRVKEAEPELLRILAGKRVSSEEKLAALQSLLIFYDHASRDQVAQFANSDRIGMRRLSAYLVRHFDRKEDADLLLPLLTDSSSEVRAEVLQTFGLLRLSAINGKDLISSAQSMTGDKDERVAVSAAWFLTLHGEEEGKRAFSQKMESEKEATRRLAAAALASSGKNGLSLMTSALEKSQDPYVRANVSLGLISLREACEPSCCELNEILQMDKTRWCWEEEGVFRALAPSRLRHNPAIPNYPEAVNQMTRLEVLNVLAIMQYPGSEGAIRQFLKENKWGISSTASALLLTEGNEQSIQLVKGLLQDPDREIQTEAALVLALWGKEEEALRILRDSYPAADRDRKEKILEGIGRVGGTDSIPFLVEAMEEPYPILRMIAASSLLLCIYH